MEFPSLSKDPADIVDYAMDWSDRLPGSARIASIAITVNGDVEVTDLTSSYPASALVLRVSGGTNWGWTGNDPQTASLAVVSVLATLTDGEKMSRSFRVITRQL